MFGLAMGGASEAEISAQIFELYWHSSSANHALDHLDPVK